MFKCPTCDDLNNGVFCMNPLCDDPQDDLTSVSHGIAVPRENIIQWDESLYGPCVENKTCRDRWIQMINDGWKKVLDGQTMWLNIGDGYFIRSNKAGAEWMFRSNTSVHYTSDKYFCEKFRPIYARYCRWGLPSMSIGGIGVFMRTKDASAIDREIERCSG